MVEKGEIGAGLKMLAGALQHDAAQIRLAIEPREGVEQRIDQRAVIGVADPRPIQRHGRDTARIDGTENRLIFRHYHSATDPIISGRSKGRPHHEHRRLLPLTLSLSP